MSGYQIPLHELRMASRGHKVPCWRAVPFCALNQIAHTNGNGYGDRPVDRMAYLTFDGRWMELEDKPVRARANHGCLRAKHKATRRRVGQVWQQGLCHHIRLMGSTRHIAHPRPNTWCDNVSKAPGLWPFNSGNTQNTKDCE